MGITVGGLYFDYTFADFENRNVEGTTTEVVYRDCFVLLFVEPISERCRRGLVDNPLHIETGNFAGILSRLPLRIVKVCRDSDDCFGDRLPKVVFRRFL